MKRTLFTIGLIAFCHLQTYGQAVQASDLPNASSATALIKTTPDTAAVEKLAATGKPVLPRKYRKSARKAFFLSLLVPGSGEYYVGQKGYTKGFGATEAVIWSAALFNKYQGDMRRRDYIAYAAQQAGSNPGRSDDLYYQNIYEWPNSYWYNEDLVRQARELYPYDPAAQQAYVADKQYSEEDSWEWQNYDQFYYYRGLRVKSRNYLHRISYSVGASVLNHMLSAVNAARLAKRFNKRSKLSQAPDWRLECYSYQPETITLAFLRSF